MIPTCWATLVKSEVPFFTFYFVLREVIKKLEYWVDLRLQQVLIL